MYNLLAYGIEGIHYNKVTEDVIDICSDRYSIGNFTFGNKKLSYKLSHFSETLDEDLKEFDERAIISPLLEFSFDPTPVAGEIAAITEVTEEIEGPVFVGAVDPEEYIPKVIEKYRQAGLDKVIAEQQKQINNWLKEQSNR